MFQPGNKRTPWTGLCRKLSSANSVVLPYGFTYAVQLGVHCLGSAVEGMHLGSREDHKCVCLHRHSCMQAVAARACSRGYACLLNKQGKVKCREWSWAKRGTPLQADYDQTSSALQRPQRPRTQDRMNCKTVCPKHSTQHRS